MNTPAQRTALIFLIVISIALLAAGAVTWHRARIPDRYAPAPPSATPPSARADAPLQISLSPSLTPSSELRGRRGIIKEIVGNRISLETADPYTAPGEMLTVFAQPATSFVLITIPKTRPAYGNAITRSPASLYSLAPGDEAVVVSFRDITASTTFSAMRIEKIITP